MKDWAWEIANAVNQKYWDDARKGEEMWKEGKLLSERDPRQGSIVDYFAAALRAEREATAKRYAEMVDDGDVLSCGSYERQEIKPCPRCNGQKVIQVKHGRTFDTDSAEERADAWHAEPCPECATI